MFHLVYLHFLIRSRSKRQESLHRGLVTTIETGEDDESVEDHSPERIPYARVIVKHPRSKRYI